MFVRRFALALCLVTIAMTQPVAAQSAEPAGTVVAQAGPEGGVPVWVRPETPEQRRERLSTPEDPGPDPDPKKTFYRFGRPFHIERFERRWAAYDKEPGFVRPMAMVNVATEIYQQNEKYVWVWIPDATEAVPTEESAPSAPAPLSYMGRYDDGHVAFLSKVRSQWDDVSPRRSSQAVAFDLSSEGLPSTGSWRSSLSAADMNGDGLVDLLLPPQRGGASGEPAIYLGDGMGKWKQWREVRWPGGLDYGSAVAADFNRDGKMDAAFGVHLLGLLVFLGDGKGNFVDSSEGLPKSFPTRKIEVADVNRDGFPDLVASHEGPVNRADGDPSAAKLRVFLNRERGKKWEASNVMDPAIRVGGDWLTVANLNGDSYPDFIGSSVFFGSMDVVHLSNGKMKWKVVPSDGDTIPSLAYYFASSAAKITSRKKDDAIVSYVHAWPDDLDDRLVPRPKNPIVTAIDRIAFGSDNRISRTPIARWAGSEGIRALATADMNGDGHMDIVYTRYAPRELVVLLGDGKGGFEQAVVEGVALPPNSNYDIKLADINRDKRPDIILMFETSGKSAFATRDGGIRVYLTRRPS